MVFGAGKYKPPALEALAVSPEPYCQPALPGPPSSRLLCHRGGLWSGAGATPQTSLPPSRRARCQDVLKSDPLSQCQDTAEGECQPQPLRGAPVQATSSAWGPAVARRAGGMVLGHQCPPAVPALPHAAFCVLDALSCPPSPPVTQLPHRILTPSPVLFPVQGPLPWRSWFLGWRRTQPSSSAWHAPHRQLCGGWCGTVRRRA